MEYTVVIRTLGKAGEKYQKMLDSLKEQTIQPREIIVYIAEGYDIPKETIGVERYVYVKKGMVAQRALQYDEVKTEYILFLDDDVFLPPDAVNTLYRELKDYNGDVISPDVFDNAARSLKMEVMMTISGRMRARRRDKRWGYKVIRTAGYSYNKNPQGVLLSQSNAGPCFFCKKEIFINSHFEDELWLDSQKYPLGEDQIMYYKMYKNGLKVLTSYDSGIVHLDAGSARVSEEKASRVLYSDLYFKTVFWHRFIYKPETSCILKLWDIICLCYMYCFTILISLVKFEFAILKTKWSAIIDGWTFVKSDKYKQLPLIK